LGGMKNGCCAAMGRGLQDEVIFLDTFGGVCYYNYRKRLPADG